MPRIIKPRTLGLLTRTERRSEGASFIVSILGLFDLAAPGAARFEGDQALWMLAGKLVPPERSLDIGMPKPWAELMVGGYAPAPNGAATERVALEWRVGNQHKQLLVTGDRYWRVARAGLEVTPPVPFLAMPLVPERCFGGPAFPLNPQGRGHDAAQRTLRQELVPLPNVEIPTAAIRSVTDLPQPAAFGPIAFDAPRRRAFAGTYDERWLRTAAPALPEDTDPRLFLSGPDDQQFSGYLEGGEPYRLRHFAADQEVIQGHLPRQRVRAFVGKQNGEVVELKLQIDTLWLFAGARRGVLIYRGGLKVERKDAKDVADVMVAYEGADAPPRSMEHYREVRRLRSDPELAHKYAFAESQLAPDLTPELVRERNAKRHELAQARRLERHANQTWLVNRMFAGDELPPELRPGPPEPTPADELPMPLPEELESGEFDLAALLDAVEIESARLTAEFERLERENAAAMKAFTEVQDGQAGPGAIDRLLEALGQGEVAATLDSALAEMPALPELPAEAGAEASAELETAKASLAGLSDWRSLMLGNAGAPVDEAAQFAAARARFYDLPEASPLDAMRQALQTMPEIPDLPDLALPVEAQVLARPPAVPTLDDLLADLQAPGTPPEAAEALIPAAEEADSGIPESLCS